MNVVLPAAAGPVTSATSPSAGFEVDVDQHGGGPVAGIDASQAGQDAALEQVKFRSVGLVAP